MKSLLIYFVFIHSLLAFDYTLKPEKVSEETHCFFGLPEVMDEHNNGNMVNSCFVNMGTSYLVIDSGPTYSYALQAYEKMKKINNLPISYVINTHVHDDHWLGNSYYASIGVKIIGSSVFKNESKVEMTRMQKRISQQAYAKTTQIFPTIFVKDEKVLDIDGKKVYIKSVNKKAHTNSDLLIYIPDGKIVFVGDLVFNDRLPSIRDGNLNGWLESLDKVRAMDVDFIVGGHGEIVDRTSIDMTYNYIKTLRDRVAMLLEDGEEIGDVVNMVKMEKFKDINFYDSMHRQNVEIAYRMLEWESE
ncbi:MBL fold metallo-hydrolase [Sulfurimonas sp. CS5]|uniref:MBL fold metallo-hydrolase n=1 Tax=Sulfurimonas sp. CS5 TaxID=3391145 RepID=UPI0039EBEB02